VPVNGQLAREGTTGYNPGLKAYPHDPAAAKRLLQEAGAVGTQVEYVGRPSQFPRATEVSELVVNWLNEIGFKAKVRFLEGAAASEALRSVKPDQPRTDLHMTSVSNPVLDSSRAFDVYHACGGRNNIGCDTDWDRKYTEAKGLAGDARDKAFQGLWESASEMYKYVPLFGLNWAHGTSAKLQWTPRLDGLVVLTSMSLNS
jgi:peptide/nickel transport system substrate-binding protein